MSTEFDLQNASPDVLRYCKAISESMQKEFQLSEDDAVRRINEKWQGHSFENEELLFHEPPEFWAYDIYYRHVKRWWLLSKEELKALELPTSSGK